MKAKFLALAALVLGLASCQTEPESLGVNVGGEVDTYVTVSLPEATRAADSAEGAFKNLVDSDEYTIRYIFQVFYNENESLAARQVIYSDGNTVSFPVRLVPGREYNFVAWADVVLEDGKTLDVLGVYNKESDYRYNTEKLDAVTFKGDWLAMDETFDAYTDAQTIEYYGTTSINLNLIRPFAKLRVMTTDMVELGNLQIVPEGVTVAYTVPVYKSFDVTAQAAKTTGASTHTFTYNLSEVQEYTATETTSTLFTNYLFGAENGVVKFTMNVNDTTPELIKFNNFNTDIPVQRNYLTTISGNILTDGNNIKVDIVKDGAFEGEKEWPNENNIAEQLAYAAMFGGEVTLTDDITLTQPLTIVNGANVVINLDGNTITGAFVKGEGAIIENNGILTLVGGTIKNTETNGDAVINNNGELVLDGVKIEGAPIGTTGYPNYAVYTSGKLTVENETQIISDRGALNMQNGADVTINGGNFAVTDAIGTRVLTAHLIYAYGSSSKLTINDGSFAMKIANGGGTSVICPAGATIKVYGGNFYHAPVSDSQSGCFQNYMGYGAPVDVYGGVFNDDTVTKSGNLAAGYKAEENDGWYYVITNDTELVSSDVEFSDALTAGQNVLLASDVNIAKIDLTTVSNDMVIDGNGNSITTSNFYGVEVTAGKNITLKNTEVVITVDGNYINYSAGLKIANGDYAGNTIKLENCVIRMHNTDWAYAVTMPASVKNLNLVIDNCVLEGAIALQCWGDNNTITVTDSKLICNYTTSALYTSYCVALQGDGTYNSENNKLAISNCEFSYSGVDNFNSTIKSVYAHTNTNTNTITVSNCTYVDVAD